MITILAIGKKHEDWVQAGITRYQQRLRAPFNVEWVLLPHSSLTGDSARLDESERLLVRLKPDDRVLLLDERGHMFDSTGLSALLADTLGHTTRGTNLVIIIGGAYGVTDAVRQRAQQVWSLSPLVFPHQLVRLMLIEQLYRAQQIENGAAYHHS